MHPRPFRPTLLRLETRTCLSGPTTAGDYALAMFRGAMELIEAEANLVVVAAMPAPVSTAVNAAVGKIIDVTIAVAADVKTANN